MVHMAPNGEIMDDMTWWTYVQRHSNGDPNAHIARRIGVTPSSVGRWSKGSGPEPTQAAAFAREYGRPVLEAFLAAGYLTPREAGERPTAEVDPATLSDAELLDEVERRMRGEASWSGNTSPEDRKPPTGGTVHQLPQSDDEWSKENPGMRPVAARKVETRPDPDDGWPDNDLDS